MMPSVERAIITCELGLGNKETEKSTAPGIDRLRFLLNSRRFDGLTVLTAFRMVAKDARRK